MGLATLQTSLTESKKRPSNWGNIEVVFCMSDGVGFLQIQPYKGNMKTQSLILVIGLILTSAFRTSILSAEETISSTSLVAYGGTSNRLDKINCGVFVPKGWQISKRDLNGTTICYKITEDATCQKGLTINVITNVSSLTIPSSKRIERKVDATLYAAYQNEEYKEKCTKVIKDWSKDTPLFALFGCEVIKTIDGTESRIRATAMANKKTDTLYVIMFGCPASEWNSLLPTIKTMMTLDIDESF